MKPAGICLGRETKRARAEGICHKVLQSKNAEQEGEDEVSAEVGSLVNNGNRSQDDSAAVVALLKACTNQHDLGKGNRLHAHILERGLLQTNTFVGNNLVNMYAK
eukprot:c43611_g1_i1 orf=256-570(+)